MNKLHEVFSVKITAKQAAALFRKEAESLGWRVSAHGRIVTITQHFAPGDMDAFCRMDSEYGQLFAMVPARGGSMWGTDGGSVGGYAAIRSGKMVMNISGVSKRFVEALA
jgi:hypothetical protein